MKDIELPIAELKPALTGLGKIIGKRSTLPVLGHLRIERTKDGWITLTSTDLDTFITLRLEQPAHGEPTVLLIPFEDLSKLIKTCKSEESILVSQKTKTQSTIRYSIGTQFAEKNVETIDAAEYPPIPKISGDAISLPDSLREAIHQAFECASTDQTRIVINSAYLDVSDSKCQSIVGTDGRHLYASNSFKLDLKDSLIIPTNKFLGWKQFNTDGEWKLRVEPGKKASAGHLQISSRRWRFITRQVEGNYPNWRQVIPTMSTTQVEIAPDEIESVIALIERMPCEPKNENKSIGLKIGKNKLTLQSRASFDDKWTEVEITGVKTSGNPLTIHLNRELLVKALTFGLTKIELQDDKSALRFVGTGKQMIVMPVRPDAIPSTPAPTPAPTPGNEENGNGEAETVDSEPEQQPATAESNADAQPERNPMPRSNGTTNTASREADNGEMTRLETALVQIETIKGSYREAIKGLNELTETLKQAQRERKSSDKEVQSVRSTLEKLQTLRI